MTLANGMHGYLVTVTSVAEQQFLATHLGRSEAWMGASDGASECPSGIMPLILRGFHEAPAAGFISFGLKSSP